MIDRLNADIERRLCWQAGPWSVLVVPSSKIVTGEGPTGSLKSGLSERSISYEVKLPEGCGQVMSTALKPAAPAEAATELIPAKVGEAGDVTTSMQFLLESMRLGWSQSKSR